ncbi:MAG: hypothetical protein DSY91_03100 [Deltaproteobacteria bacterium]|nr:MAG: hypothetical protein DSY91_03100 [Deltaproteobacteria bacterium]
MRILRVFFRSILPFLVVFTFSCAIITVNIYFPAHDVEKAYENLEDQLLKPPPENQAPKKEESPSKKNPPKDLNSFYTPGSWFVTNVYAGDNMAARISQLIMKMPNVVEAYRRMGKRMAKINQLRDKQLVGEANSGFLTPFTKLNRNQALLMKDENNDRSIVILGMAKAILKINHLEINKKNLDKVFPKAAAQFAELRRKKAKPGWKIQLPDGKWVVKK